MTRARKAGQLKVKGFVTVTSSEICTAGKCVTVPSSDKEAAPDVVTPGTRRHVFVLVRMEFKNLRPTEKRAISSRDVVLVDADGRRLRATGLAKGEYGPPRFLGCVACRSNVSTKADDIVAEFAFVAKKASLGKGLKVRFRDAPEIVFSLSGEPTA